MPENPKKLAKYKKEIDTMRGYISSPIYLQRLAQAGIKNPTGIIEERLKILDRLKYDEGSFSPQTYGSYNDKTILMPKEYLPYKFMHELGHATAGSSSYPVDSEKSGMGGQMSPYESFMFYNRNKNISPDMLDTLKSISQKKYFGGSTYHKPFPMEDEFAASNLAEVIAGRPDPHDVGSSEGYGDLMAMRYRLKELGYTKNFGDNITPEIWKKAIKDKRFNSDKNIMRARKNYGDQSLIELNNKVAQSDNINNEENIA